MASLISFETLTAASEMAYRIMTNSRSMLQAPYYPFRPIASEICAITRPLVVVRPEECPRSRCAVQLVSVEQFVVGRGVCTWRFPRLRNQKAGRYMGSGMRVTACTWPNSSCHSPRRWLNTMLDWRIRVDLSVAAHQANGRIAPR
jgi:hypothetical protein